MAHLGHSLQGYGTMAADTVRAKAYFGALESVVTPDSVVLDIGAGPGLFSLFAAHLGAKQVYAIEQDPIVALVSELAAFNGLTHRLTAIHGRSTQVTLPQRADVIVSDLHGVLPFFQYHLPAIIDARHRLLKPGGHLIPQHETVRMAVVSDPEAHAKQVGPWESTLTALRLDPARSRAANDFSRVTIVPDRLATEPQIWCELDYHQLTSPHANATLSWHIRHDVVAHGLVAWFDAVLAPGVTLSNAPGEPSTIYGQAFFPWPQPVPMLANDDVVVALSATLVGAQYVWQWTSRLMRGGQTIATFDQSSFYGTPFSKDDMARRRPEAVPVLNAHGEACRWILDQMNGRRSMAEIARGLWSAFRSEFNTEHDAFDCLADLASEYGSITRSTHRRAPSSQETELIDTRPRVELSASDSQHK